MPSKFVLVCSFVLSGNENESGYNDRKKESETEALKWDGKLEESEKRDVRAKAN